MPTPEELKSGYVPEAEIAKLLAKFETYAQTLQRIADSLGADMPRVMPAESPVSSLAAIKDYAARLFMVIEEQLRHIKKLEKAASRYAAIDALMDGSDDALGQVFATEAVSSNEDASDRLYAQVMELGTKLRVELQRSEDLGRSLLHVTSAAHEMLAKKSTQIKMRDAVIRAHERAVAELTAENAKLRLACGLPPLELPAAALPWLSGAKGSLSASVSSDKLDPEADSAAASSSASGSIPTALQQAKRMRIGAPQ